MRRGKLDILKEPAGKSQSEWFASGGPGLQFTCALRERRDDAHEGRRRFAGICQDKGTSRSSRCFPSHHNDKNCTLHFETLLCTSVLCCLQSVSTLKMGEFLQASSGRVSRHANSEQQACSLSSKPASNGLKPANPKTSTERDTVVWCTTTPPLVVFRTTHNPRPREGEGNDGGHKTDSQQRN